jgi:hypothetical protein
VLIAIAVAAVAQPGDGQAATPQPPRWVASIDLAIGGADGGEGADFGRISGLAFDSTGRIFVADRQDEQIRVFTPAGALQSRIGRKGSGPLEFLRLATIAIGPDGFLWARDEGNARMVVIDVARQPALNVRTMPLKKFTAGNTTPLNFVATGELVDESIWFDPQLKTFRPVVSRLTKNGDVARADTLVIPPSAQAGIHKYLKPQKDASGKVNGMAEYSVHQPHGPMWLRAYGPRGFRADAVGSRYAVNVFDVNGKVVRTLQRTVAPVALSPRERRVADSTLKAKETELPFGVPDAKPPIIALRWSRDGALWVERSTADGQPREADVYDANGRWIAIATWPREVELVSWHGVIAGRDAIAVTRDEDGVESVVRLRFR